MKRVLISCILVLAIAAPAAARAGVVVSREFSFTPGDPSDAAPTLQVLQGSSLTLLNMGNALHSVRSDNFVPNSSTRLFESAAVGGRRTADVTGVASLAPGIYDFHCAVHASTMRGRLVVV